MATEIRNAVIESARIEINDHGFLDCWIMLDYGGSVQGFGGYSLYLPKSFTHHRLLSSAGHFIYRVMEIANVSDWSRMAGRTVRAKIVDGSIASLGHIVKDDWFTPSEDFKEAKQ